MAFRREIQPKSNYRSITISLLSPDKVLAISNGEVTKAETINYRSYKPEPGGLFCERIFGPVKDWECHCGKYKRIRYRGIVCDRCGVEVTEKKVRRERIGHINLAVPVVHIWFFRSLPNKIGALLGLNTKKLEQVIYYENYVVINPGIIKEVQYLDLLTEEQYLNITEKLPKDNHLLDDSHPDKFIAKMGGEAIYDLLKRLNLDELSYSLRHQASIERSQQKKSEILKRLQIIEALRDANTRVENRPEWMIVKVLPVIPPELRPLVPLDGGRFASADLNDLYRRVIIRNNRLKRLVEVKAPDIILRNEKRMLQEALDSLFDNSKKTSAVKTESNRPLKSLSDNLKGKQGRFRQNLLGKRVDYSGRSVIVVGPELKLNECGLPKEMAAELFKPFIIRSLLERGIVRTVKSAKRIIERKEPVIWDILENILKGHPVLLNRAPTLHRLGIQAFQPKLVEGKAIQIHPLVCTAFNADFDGDQMAIHVPLSHAATLEAQFLMLASHNILNPANGTPIAVPSQDMVLGLYYITKPRKSSSHYKALGENNVFYSPEEVIIAYNEKRIALHTIIKLRYRNSEDKNEIIETTVGRVLFNEIVPKEIGFINELLTKRSLRDIIGKILKKTNLATTAKFLDDLKELGFKMAFEGGLSIKMSDIITPDEKLQLIEEAKEEVDNIMMNYNIGIITNNERYNQIIDVWTHTNTKLTKILIDKLTRDQDGFNPIFMMLDSGARGSKEQIRQLGGMRGLMAKPQKSTAIGNEIIENPILSNFKEGLSILEYFISTHGARKGLADTALKTADAGYLTRRLVDVAQDVIITEEDCGTLRGLVVTDLKKNDEIVETMSERILGRVSLHNIHHPNTGQIIIHAGEEFTEEICEIIKNLPIESVEIRSVLTCESTHGVCAKCYGRNLATSKMVQKGEAVGVIAAQSIGEPGTQLTLRTFHVGGTAASILVANKIIAKYDGVISFEELRVVNYETTDNKKYDVVIGRSGEMKILDPITGTTLTSAHIPYGAHVYFKNGDKVNKGDLICDWDPYNALIISEVNGKVSFENIIEGFTYKEEADEQTGYHEKIIVESRLKNKNPIIHILSPTKEIIKSYDLPVGSHIIVKDGDYVKAGEPLIKIPRTVGKAGDITGGLPRVIELFEARHPSDPAIIAEIDGVVTINPKLKRGHREITITSRTGEEKTYLIPVTKQILAQSNDFVKAGTPLSDGEISSHDILAIKGPTAVQEYLVNEIQEVYRLQGVKINDKHFEIIVRQMMRKVQIEDPGDTKFLEDEVVNKFEFQQENDRIMDMKIIVDPGDSQTLRSGQIITPRKLREEISYLKRNDKKLPIARDVQPATAKQVLQGITRASLQTQSFISAASFQETTKVLADAAVNGKRDYLLGLKENVIVGHPIPAGTGLREYEGIIVSTIENMKQFEESKKESIPEIIK